MSVHGTVWVIKWIRRECSHSIHAVRDWKKSVCFVGTNFSANNNRKQRIWGWRQQIQDYVTTPVSIHFYIVVFIIFFPNIIQVIFLLSEDGTNTQYLTFNLVLQSLGFVATIRTVNHWERGGLSIIWMTKNSWTLETDWSG